MVCEGIWRFGVGARIAVDVVVGVAQHDPGADSGPSGVIAYDL
jgi:hypothetical protein